MSVGRKADPVWLSFEKVAVPDKTYNRARCKICKKEMQGLVSRMRKHLNECDMVVISEDEENEINDSVSTIFEGDSDTMSTYSNTSSFESDTRQAKLKPPSKKLKEGKAGLDRYVVKTPKALKESIDHQVARTVFATNSPFAFVENKEFISLIQMLRPGYSPPSRFDIGGKLLDNVYDKMLEEFSNELKGKTVCMAMDGWSNIHREPIVCVSVSMEGKTYLVDTVDTSGHSHVSEYLQELANAALLKCEEKFGCRVKSVVTDNAANMAKMRFHLTQGGEDIRLISYGCGAHLLNLLAQDVQVPGVKEQVVDVVKYFRNHQMAAAAYKANGGSNLCLPQDVRWNTLSDCLESYLKNWAIILKTVEEEASRRHVEQRVANKVRDFGIKRNAEDLLARLKPISVALDRMQSETTHIAEAVEIWIELQTKLNDILPGEFKKKLDARMKSALTGAHYFANLTDPRYLGTSLKQAQVEEAMEYADKNFPTFLPCLLNLRGKSTPFKEYYFTPVVLKNLSASAWWKSFQGLIADEDIDAALQLHTAVASSAGVERIFSTYGFVHSKVRNRLGNEKAAKLVTIFKHFG